MDRGELVPDELMIACPRPPRPARCRATARSSTASRAPGARPRRSTRRSPRRAAGRSRAAHRGPDRGPDPALRRALDLPGGRPRLQRVVQATAHAGASATSTARSWSSAPTTPRRSCARAWSSSSPPLHDVVDYYRAPGHPDAGRRPAPDRGRRHVAASRRSDGRRRRPTMITRKSRARDREHAAGRPDRGRGPRPGRIASSSRASRPASSTASPSARSGHAGAMPSFKGYLGAAVRQEPTGVPGEPVHLDRQTRSSTASPASGRSATGRSCRSTSARSSTAGTATRPGRSSSATCPRTVQGARRRDAPGDDGGIAAASRATASATSRRRSRTWRARLATAIVRPFVGHGIGTEMHEEPQVPNYRTGRAARSSSRACASRSSRCSRSAATRSTSSPTAGPSSRATAPWPPTSSTPSPSPSRTGVHARSVRTTGSLR